MVFIFARNSQQANAWVRNVKAGVNSCSYIWRDELLRGHHKGFYVRVGEYWKHENAAKIEEMLKEREMIEIQIATQKQ